MKTALILTSLLMAFSVSVKASDTADIKDFVRQVFVSGIPYEEAVKYDSGEAESLKLMLNDPSESEHWANIVVMMEIIGDESVVDDVISFIEKDVDGEYPEDLYRAKEAAIFGLGYLANGLESKTVEKYLESSLDPDVWNKRGLKGVSIEHPTLEQRNENLSRYAVLALALSGSESASKMLKDVKASKTKMQKFEKFGDIIDAAIQENEEIRRKGMQAYYKNSGYH